MRKLFCILAIILLIGCSPRDDWSSDPPVSLPRATTAPGLAALISAYPDQHLQVLPNYIKWPDGSYMPYNIEVGYKDYETLLNYPDLEDHMAVPYPKGREYPIPREKTNSPGRIRYYPFFKKMYGRTAKEVKEKLVPVQWLPSSVNKTLMITSVNGVDKKLQAVSDALDQLPGQLQKYVSRTSGTFSWRNIALTHRLSAHSFGIAIDIDTTYASYWKWDYPVKSEKDPVTITYKNRIPMEIVEIFEAHGFIWGGKWYQYDTMHFEYRPELLVNTF